MHELIGQPIAALDTPKLLLDLDVLDENLVQMQEGCQRAQKRLRVHFKSLKSGSLARYLATRGVQDFACAKLNEAEVLVEFGLREILVANQIVGSAKLERLARLAQLANLSVCVDALDQVRALGEVARRHNVTIGVLIEVDIGMNRCGVPPGDEVVQLARALVAEPGLRFVGLQGYDGHLQMLPDPTERARLCRQGLDRLKQTRELVEAAGFEVNLVSGAGTGTWSFACEHAALTELQPGSFLLMDAAYHWIRPEFNCSLSVLTTVISRRPGWYVLDAGSKAISQDFGKPLIKGRPEERVLKLAEEHTCVAIDGPEPSIGQVREVIPAHCCATMNLHRLVLACRKGLVEGVWLIEASGRYD